MVQYREEVEFSNTSIVKRQFVLPMHMFQSGYSDLLQDEGFVIYLFCKCQELHALVACLLHIINLWQTILYQAIIMVCIAVVFIQSYIAFFKQYYTMPKLPTAN